jgi:glucose-6-phosphate dehydrogenase assembly protein OpcA
MPVEVSSSGVIFTGEDGVNLYRMATIIMGMKAEMRGMRLTSKAKAPSCFTIARREFGLRGSKEKIFADMTALYNAAKAEQGLQ